MRSHSHPCFELGPGVIAEDGVVISSVKETEALTFPTKTRSLAWKCHCAVMGPKEEAYDSKAPY
jgi:hypothetical protein